MAAPFTVRVEGLKEIDAKLGALGPKLGPATLSLALQRAGEPTAVLARALAPFDPTREKGRHLRDTIKVTTTVKRTQRPSVTPGSAHAFIGPAGKGSSHGHLLEFGHKLVVGRRKRIKRTIAGRTRTIVSKDTRRVVGFVAPRPFLEPAWNATKSEVLTNFAREVWDVCVAVARGAVSAAKAGTLDRRAARSLEG